MGITRSAPTVRSVTIDVEDIQTALHSLYYFDLSLVTWETGDGLEVRTSSDEFLAKNQPNRLRNTEMGNPAPEAQLTTLAGDLWRVKL